MEKYIISEENERLGDDLDEILESLSTKKLNKADKATYTLGFNSPLLTVPTIALYDDSLLMEKYPNGIVTENLVLIPADKFKELKEKSTIFSKSVFLDKDQVEIKTDNFRPFLNEFMLAFVEMSLNVDMTKEEREQIKNELHLNVTREEESLIKTGFYKSDYKNAYRNVNVPEKVTNRDLLKIIEGKEYTLESTLKDSPDLSVEVKEILKENESYLEKIATLKQKIQEVTIKEVDANVTIEQFTDIVEKSLNYTVSPVLPLKIVNKKIHEVIEQTNADVHKFTEDAEKKIFPYLSKLPYLQFKSSMELIATEVFGSITNKNLNYSVEEMVEAKERFSTILVKDLDAVQRNYLITIISGFDALTKNIFKTDKPINKMK